MSYKWEAPKAAERETWLFYNHPRQGYSGAILKGSVMMVSTHYSKGVAYHIFEMQVSGYKRRRCVGEESLIEEAKP